MKQRGRFGAVATSFLLVSSLALSAGAAGLPAEELQPLNPPPMVLSDAMIDETPQSWFVELSGPSLSEGGNPAALKREKDAFAVAASQAGANFQQRFAFDSLFNGLSISADRVTVNALSRLPGVKAVWPVVTVERPETFPGDTSPEMYTALAMSGADVAQSELGYTGKGIKVAVMDTGIDYLHPDLGGCFGPDCKVTIGWDFVGDAFNADPSSPSYNPVTVPDPDPMDCQGHGTHVAGIVGANGTVRGVAPDVTFGAYRVFGCAGSTTADIMLAAMEQALADGMDVLNMSIGSAFQWPQYPTAVAASRLVDQDMVVVASIGNSGANGLYAAGAPGLGEKVIGVASFDNTHISQSAFTVSPDNRTVGYAPATAAPLPPTTGWAELARTGSKSIADDACAPLPAGGLEGKIALIRRGGCTFYQKSFHAQSAGAVGVVLYNNGAGAFSPTVAAPGASDPAITIPVVAILRADGEAIDDRLAAGPVTLTWTDLTQTVPNPTGGRISDFSSYGLSPDLVVKPDIGAPGGSIYSTYPLNLGGYATLGGTSMSSPHVAGAVALLLEAKPQTKAADVRAILQNSALPRNWWGNPALGFLDNVHRQGAGMLQIDKAIQAATAVEPSKLSLGESEGGPSQVTLTLHNNSHHPVTYSFSHAPALATGPDTFTPRFYGAFAEAAFATESLTIPGQATRTVNVTITAPDFDAHSMYGGYLVITPDDGGQEVRVPYAGMVGDYQAKSVLTPTPYGFPWLVRVTGSGYEQQAEGATFTMANGDIPYVVLHLDHHASKLQLEVLDAVTGESWNLAGQEEYLPRNSTSAGYYTLTFDGITTRGNGNGSKTYVVPDGQYVLKVNLLKALGDERNPEHWESWTSPAFTIDRP